MKNLILFGIILFSFNSYAEITYTCGADVWNQSRLVKNKYEGDLTKTCTTNLNIEDINNLEAALILRFQEASDVLEVHKVGENEESLGVNIISNLKSVIPNRGEMNIKYNTLIKTDGENTVSAFSNSMSIIATGYSRFTKKIKRWVSFSVKNNKVVFVFREYNQITKPNGAPARMFTSAAKKGIAAQGVTKIRFLMSFLNQTL